MDGDKRKEKVMAFAFQEAFKWGGIGTALGGAITVCGICFSPWFMKSFSISAKTSIPVMLGLFSWTLSYELAIIRAYKQPEKWGLIESKIDKD